MLCDQCEKVFPLNPHLKDHFTYSIKRLYLSRSFLATVTMVFQMTSCQKRLVKHLKKKSEKYVRAIIQAEYLQECLTKHILPRSINLVKLIKSKILWENSKTDDTFEILFEAGVKLLKEQLKNKEEIFKRIDEEGNDLRKTLRAEIGPDKFREEDERLKKHMLNVYNVEKVLK